MNHSLKTASQQDDSPSQPVNDADVFVPFTWSMKEIKSAIPAHLFVRSTTRGLVYLIRDLILAATLWKAASFIDPCFSQPEGSHILKRSMFEAFRWAAWLT